MANSMTGYGRAQMQSELYDITAEIKAVNHRYFEVSVKTPRGYSFLEEKITAALKKSGLLASGEKQTDTKKFILVASISLVAFIAIVLCIIYVLNGNVVFGKN